MRRRCRAFSLGVAVSFNRALTAVKDSNVGWNRGDPGVRGCCNKQGGEGVVVCRHQFEGGGHWIGQ